MTIDTILAILFFIILINSLKRLTMGVKARLTSWGMWLIMACGFIFNLTPNAIRFDGLKEYLPWIRLITYCVALVLAGWDWLIYDRLKEYVDYVKREDYELLVAQLAALKREERGNNQ